MCCRTLLLREVGRFTENEKKNLVESFIPRMIVVKVHSTSLLWYGQRVGVFTFCVVRLQSFQPGNKDTKIHFSGVEKKLTLMNINGNLSFRFRNVLSASEPG